MGGRDELVKALEAIVTRARSEPGEAPTADELLAYRDGELDAAERARVEAKLAEFPEAVLALENLASFPDVRPGPGVQVATDAETDAAWQAFRRRMGYGGGASGEPAAESTGAASGGPDGEPWRAGAGEEVVERRSVGTGTRRTRLRWWTGASLGWATALVLLVVGVLVGWMLGRQGAQPSGNLVVAQLLPVGAEPRRGEDASRVAVGEEADGVVLMLLGADAAAAESYEVEVVAGVGRPVWSGRGLEPDSAGTLWIHLPRKHLPPGTYRVLVRADAAAPATEYQFEVRMDAER